MHVGCVAIYQNAVIGVGCNSNKTHPRQKKYNRYRNLTKTLIDPVPKIHAEIMCINSIKGVDIDFSKVYLYIYRMRNDKPFGMGRPCPACMNAIIDMGIRRVYYTTDVGYAAEDLKGGRKIVVEDQ